MVMIIKFYLLQVKINQESLNQISKKLNLKITKIGKILLSSHKSSVIDQKGRVLG
jgi:hypothetical protein